MKTLQNSASPARGRTIAAAAIVWAQLITLRVALFLSRRKNQNQHPSSVQIAGPKASAQPGRSTNGEYSPLPVALLDDLTAQPNPTKFRREVEIGFPLQHMQVIHHARLARAEAAIVRLGLPLLPRWRRRVRTVYTPGYLSCLNPKLIAAD